MAKPKKMLFKWSDDVQPKKPKFTPEQKAERKLWSDADKACRALMNHIRGDGMVAIGYLTFNVRDGLNAHMSLNIEIVAKTDKPVKTGTWSHLTVENKRSKK